MLLLKPLTMDKKPLHVVSFDNPFPPVYGGVIDVFYKLKALHLQGFDIVLHCITDSESIAAPELAAITKEVRFYRRKKNQSFLKLFSFIPFAAVSRYSKALALNLLADDTPILFEGLQTTCVLKKHNFSNRKLVLRLHNIESNYFAGSQRSETNLFKRFLYGSESRKYKNYEQIIQKFNSVLTLSVAETDYVAKHFSNAHYIPVFHGNDSVAKLSPVGKYALYHGDLRLPDNKRAASFVIGIFKKIPDYNLVIASAAGADFVKDLIGDAANISYVKPVDHQHLQQLLADAHLNVMLSFQESGTKLKLVNALYRSRFCIINKNMVDDPRLQELCAMAESESEFLTAINRLKTMEYDDFLRREKVLSQVLNDSVNAAKIGELLS